MTDYYVNGNDYGNGSVFYWMIGSYFTSIGGSYYFY